MIKFPAGPNVIYIVVQQFLTTGYSKLSTAVGSTAGSLLGSLPNQYGYTSAIKPNISISV